MDECFVQLPILETVSASETKQSRFFREIATPVCHNVFQSLFSSRRLRPAGTLSSVARNDLLVEAFSFLYQDLGVTPITLPLSLYEMNSV